MDDRIYPSGFFASLPNEKQKEFMPARLNVKRKDALKWLQGAEHLEDENGFINIDLKRKMKDREKLYAQVNTYGKTISQPKVNAQDHSPDRDSVPF